MGNTISPWVGDYPPNIWPPLGPTTPMYPMAPSPYTDPWVCPGTGTALFPSISFYPEKTALNAYEELCAAIKTIEGFLELSKDLDSKKIEWLAEIRELVRQHEIAKIDERLK